MWRLSTTSWYAGNNAGGHYASFSFEQIFQREIYCVMTSQQLRTHILLFNDNTIHSLLEQKVDKYSPRDANMNNASTLLAPEAVDHFFRQRS